MKRILISLILIHSLLLSFSCKEDFSPKTEFKSGYSVDCIVSFAENQSGGYDVTAEAGNSVC